MPRRYAATPLIRGGKTMGTPTLANSIYFAVKSGDIPASEMTLKEGMRLDILAGQHYGDARLWWVIAAASGIGWGLQVPAGTYLRIPEPSIIAGLS